MREGEITKDDSKAVDSKPTKHELEVKERAAVDKTGYIARVKQLDSHQGEHRNCKTYHHSIRKAHAQVSKS